MFFLFLILTANILFWLNTMLYVAVFIWSWVPHALVDIPSSSTMSRVLDRNYGNFVYLLYCLYPAVYVGSVIASWSLFYQSVYYGEEEMKYKFYAVLLAFIPLLYLPIDPSFEFFRNMFKWSGL